MGNKSRISSMRPTVNVARISVTITLSNGSFALATGPTDTATSR